MIENFCISVVEKLTLVEMPVHPENIVDDNPETLNNPIMPGNDGDQEPDAASFVSAEIGEFETTLLMLFHQNLITSSVHS